MSTLAAPLPNRDEAKDLWSSGLSVPEISLKLGVKVATIHKWIARYRWKRSPVQPDAQNSQAQAIDTQDVAQRITALALEQAERLMRVIQDNKVRTISDSKTASSALAASYATARKALGLDDHNAPQQHLHVHVMRDTAARVASPADLAVMDAQIVSDDSATTPPAPPTLPASGA